MNQHPWTWMRKRSWYKPLNTTVWSSLILDKILIFRFEPSRSCWTRDSEVMRHFAVEVWIRDMLEGEHTNAFLEKWNKINLSDYVRVSERSSHSGVRSAKESKKKKLHLVPLCPIYWFSRLVFIMYGLSFNILDFLRHQPCGAISFLASIPYCLFSALRFGRSQLASAVTWRNIAITCAARLLTIPLSPCFAYCSWPSFSGVLRRCSSRGRLRHFALN